MNDYIMMIIGIVIVAVIYVAVFTVLIADYIMRSIAYYTMAKCVGIKKPWLAWIPVASYWLRGAVVAKFEGRKGIKREWHKVLLGLALICVVTVVFIYIFMIVLFIIIELNLAPRLVATGGVGTIIALYIFIFVAALAVTALRGCYTICCYKLFEEIMPEKAIKYIILSLVVPLAGSICLLRCKDRVFEMYTAYVQQMKAEEQQQEKTENSDI